VRILHLSTNDISGGAAKAAHRLHTSLCSLSQESAMLVGRKDSDDPRVHVYRPSPAMEFHHRTRKFINQHLRRLGRFLARKHHEITPLEAKFPPQGSGLFSHIRSDNPGGDFISQMPPSDILHLHWINTLIDFRTFFPRVAKSHFLVWTLHDMNPFTGGCHYDNGCGRFKQNCGKCPNLGSNHERDLSRRIWNEKRQIYSQLDRSRLHIVTPSRWLAAECQQSSLLESFPVSVIPNGLDLNVFKPRNRGFSRNILGLPANSKVILFVAHSVGEKRKGFSILLKALGSLSGFPGLHLLSVGQKPFHIQGSFPHIHMGYVSHDSLLSVIYSAADIFVIPSILDNLPNTVTESISCGTPVVGFAVGGIPDLVQHGLTGLLSSASDVNALQQCIQTILMHDNLREQMSANCRKRAIDAFGVALQARAYLDLYRSLCPQAANPR
jgi:glycosyltransferase involved in cell wall biosynthesis